MKLKRLIIICLICISSVQGYSQKNVLYKFEPIKKLKKQRHRGLPDPFMKMNGTQINARQEWPNQRAYIISMLEHYQYGKMPSTPENVTINETLSEAIYDGTATRKLYTLTLKRNGSSLDLHFGLIKPNGIGKYPIIILNDRTINNVPDEINREAIRRGYIMCQYVRTDLALDVIIENSGNKDASASVARDSALSSGVFQLYPKEEYSWGVIAAWAWGYKLLINYFEKLDFIDLKKIVATGHSRGGKTALCGGIFDNRIAITVPNSSGFGGTASHRYFQLGEIEQTFGHASLMQTHWWSLEYYKLRGYENMIPFDAHFNKAAIAPRALLNTHALQDYFANPFGTQMTHEAAKKVYKWLGVENNIAMHWRTGGHAQGVTDWLALLDFADQYFFNKKVESRFDINPYSIIKAPIFWEAP